MGARAEEIVITLEVDTFIRCALELCCRMEQDQILKKLYKN